VPAPSPFALGAVSLLASAKAPKEVRPILWAAGGAAIAFSYDLLGNWLPKVALPGPIGTIATPTHPEGAVGSAETTQQPAPVDSGLSLGGASAPLVARIVNPQNLGQTTMNWKGQYQVELEVQNYTNQKRTGVVELRLQENALQTLGVFWTQQPFVTSKHVVGVNVTVPANSQIVQTVAVDPETGYDTIAMEVIADVWVTTPPLLPYSTSVSSFDVNRW